MEPDKNTPTDGANEQPNANVEPQAPADALSRTPEDLETEQAEQAASAEQSAQPQEPEKKLSPIKRFFRKVNLYFLIAALVVIVAGVIAVVNYLNSQKAPTEPNIATQDLTEEALKQLANSDASVGDTSRTLTIQGNAIISGQTLMRGDLNVAGNIQAGGSLQAPSLTISGESNLGKTQINNLQVATDTAVQGNTTLRNLNVAGTAEFSGAMKASKITVTELILSGNGRLEIPNHLSFSGATPSRSIIGSGMLGSGGSVSLNGSDTSGTINVNTGNSPNGNGCFVRVNFTKAFSGQPHVLISPVNSAAGALQYYVERNSEGFSLCSNNTPSANRGFAFDYFVTG